MTQDRDPPPGFARHPRSSPLTAPWEPLWSRADGTTFHLGLWLAPQHCNARGLAHGGLISTLADNAMGLAAVLAAGGVLAAGASAGGAVTANLSVAFLTSARPGQWLAVAATPLKSGRTLAFVEADITADGVPMARASGVFRMLAAEDKA